MGTQAFWSGTTGPRSRTAHNREQAWSLSLCALRGRKNWEVDKGDWNSVREKQRWETRSPLRKKETWQKNSHLHSQWPLGLCSDPHEARLPFLPWPRSSTLSILAQASFGHICYTKPKEPWPSGWAGAEREAKPGILVTRAGAASRGLPGWSNHTGLPKSGMYTSNFCWR